MMRRVFHERPTLTALYGEDDFDAVMDRVSRVRSAGRSAIESLRTAWYGPEEPPAVVEPPPQYSFNLKPFVLPAIVAAMAFIVARLRRGKGK